MTTIERHIRIAGMIHVVYGSAGLVAVIFGIGIFVVMAQCRGLDALRESAHAAWPWLAILVLAGAWYVFNVVFGRAARKGRQWAMGRFSRRFAILQILLLPAGWLMSIYWFWILKKMERTPEPVSARYSPQSAAKP